MKPISISAVNFKGRDFLHDLTSVNCFTGKNDSGKTAVLDAVRLALLGYHPVLGKQNTETIKLMGEHSLEMSVHLEFDNKLGIARSWKRNAKGEIKKTEEVGIDEIPAVMLDLRQYLGQTKKERITSITSRFKVEGELSEESLASQFSKIEVLPIGECGPAVKDLLAVLAKSSKKRGSIKTVQEWLPELISDLDGSRKHMSDIQKFTSGQMIALRPADPKAPKSVAIQIEAKTKELAEVVRNLNEIETQKKIIDSSTARRTELQAVIDQPVPDVNDKAKELAVLDAKVKAYKSELPEITLKIDEKLREFKGAESKIAELEAKIVGLRQKKDSYEMMRVCPTCGSEGRDWILKLQKDAQTEVQQAEKELLAAHAVRKQAVSDGKTLRTQEKTAKENDARIDYKRQAVQTLGEEIKVAGLAHNARNSAITELDHMSKIVGQVDLAQLDQLTTKQIEINKQLKELNDSEQVFNSYSSNRELMLKLEKESVGYQARIEVFKKAMAIVLAEQEAIVAKAFAFVLEHARRFTDGILPGKLGYRDGEIGMLTDVGWVAHEVMATASQTLAYIGISMALAQQSPTKIILLDEAGIIDSTRKPKVVQRLLDLCRSGVIDAVLMADPTAIGYEQFAKEKDLQLIEIV